MSKMLKMLDRAGPHYIALMMAGIFGVISPPESINDTVFSTVSIAFWLGSLFFGGMLCSIGRWKQRRGRGIKILGLLLILSSLSTYSLALIVLLPGSGVSMSLFASFIIMLGYQLRHVWRSRERARAAGSNGGATGSDLVENLGNRAASAGHYSRWHRGRSVVDREDEEPRDDHTHTSDNPDGCASCHGGTGCPGGE